MSNTKAVVVLPANTENVEHVIGRIMGNLERILSEPVSSDDLLHYLQAVQVYCDLLDRIELHRFMEKMPSPQLSRPTSEA